MSKNVSNKEKGIRNTKINITKGGVYYSGSWKHNIQKENKVCFNVF